jgi:hypothetical protein
LPNVDELFFLEICDELGVPIADEKLVGPVHVLTFLGLEIDTDEMMVRIPQSKMNALVAELKKFSKENKITLKDLQSLVGSLNCFSKAVRSARAFNRRFYDLTVRAKNLLNQSHCCREIAAAISLFFPSICRARNIMLLCNVYNINGRISAMTRLDLEVCVFIISTKARLSM